MDYVIFPHKDYMFSFYDYQLRNFNTYHESLEFDKNYKHDITLLKSNIKSNILSINEDLQFIIVKNILQMKTSLTYTCPQLLKPVLMKHINSLKNLYLGTPKLDVILDSDTIYEKYNIPIDKNKIVVIFHPEYRMLIANDKYGKHTFNKFYRNMHKWFRDMGYYIIVKDRLKGIDNKGK